MEIPTFHLLPGQLLTQAGTVHRRMLTRRILPTFIHRILIIEVPETSIPLIPGMAITEQDVNLIIFCIKAAEGGPRENMTRATRRLTALIHKAGGRRDSMTIVSPPFGGGKSKRTTGGATGTTENPVYRGTVDGPAIMVGSRGNVTEIRDALLKIRTMLLYPRWTVLGSLDPVGNLKEVIRIIGTSASATIPISRTKEKRKTCDRGEIGIENMDDILRTH